MMKDIKIRDMKFEYIEYTQFNDLQGKLKDLPKENYEKLKKSIIDKKFSFPVFAWLDKKEKIWILDAHQRILKVLPLLESDGYDIPKLPTVFIDAKDKREAKELLLLLNSKYANITSEGMDLFINEKDYEIDVAEIGEYLHIPEMDMDFKLDSGENKEKELDEMGLENKCPKCGYEW